MSTDDHVEMFWTADIRRALIAARIACEGTMNAAVASQQSLTTTEEALAREMYLFGFCTSLATMAAMFGISSIEAPPVPVPASWRRASVEQDAP